VQSQVLEKVTGGAAVYVDFVENWEVDAVVGKEFLNLDAAAVFLPEELVAGEAEDGKASLLVLVLDLYQLVIVIHRHSSFTRDIDDYQHLSLVLTQLHWVSVDVQHGNIVN